VHETTKDGRKLSTFKCIGTEAQQIQTKLYYEFLKDNMDQERNKAIQGEKILAELLGDTFDARGFNANFDKACGGCYTSDSVY
jgi:hypothetical protein